MTAKATNRRFGVPLALYYRLYWLMLLFLSISVFIIIIIIIINRFV